MSILALLAGCERLQELNQLNSRIVTLESEVAVLTAVNEVQETLINDFTTRITALESEESPWVMFDPASDPAYQTVKSHLGPIPISLKGVVSNVGGGSKVTFEVGNLSAAAMGQPTFRVRYGKRKKDANTPYEFEGETLTKGRCQKFCV